MSPPGVFTRGWDALPNVWHHRGNSQVVAALRDYANKLAQDRPQDSVFCAFCECTHEGAAFASVNHVKRVWEALSDASKQRANLRRWVSSPIVGGRLWVDVLTAGFTVEEDGPLGNPDVANIMQGSWRPGFEDPPPPPFGSPSE